MRLFGATHINFMGKRRIWYVFSAVVIGIGLVSLFTKGLSFGIDFMGGTELIVQFREPVAIGDVRSAMGGVGFGRAEIKSFGSDRDIVIRTSTIELEGGGAVGDRLREGLTAAFPGNPFVVLKEDKIGPKIGAELRRDAIYAVIASLAAIWIYIGFRFKFVYGLGAVAALAHDVLLTLGMVSLFDGVLNLEFDQNMVAAFLTIIGLSVNDTVVIFDRIRENQKIHKAMDLEQLMNRSINETLSRTIITMSTITAVLLVLLVLGGEVNRGFAFALVVGISTGTYSSIYIASAVVLEWVSRMKSRSKGKLVE
jgi:preprotein translocase SecF subunit